MIRGATLESWRAVRWHGPHDVRVDVVDGLRTESLGRGECLIDIEACGVCGTDVAAAAAGEDWIPTAEPHVTTGCRAPLTLGHEIVGRVAVGSRQGIGSEAGGLLMSRVVVWPYVACFSCERSRGIPGGGCNRCPASGHLGITADGGMANVVVVREDCCIPIPEELPLASAVLCEPLAVTMHAFRFVGGCLGQRVAIIGGGSIGLSGLDVAWFRGAREVVVIDPSEDARASALESGASAAIHPVDANQVGADLVLEASGARSGLKTAIGACSPGATVLVVGETREFEPWDLETQIAREIKVMGSVGHEFGADFAAAALALQRGELGARPRRVTYLDLDETPTALADASRRQAGTKLVVVPAATQRVLESA